MTNLELTHLLDRLLRQGAESEWIEFKQNNCSSVEIGKRISALSNGACLLNQPYGYLVFGIEDDTLEVVGTTFKPKADKIGKEELEHWLLQRLNPRIDFQIFEFDFQGKPVALFQVPAAPSQPVRFTNIDYIRIGSITRELREFPYKEQKIWRNEAQSTFENEIALQNATGAEVVELLDTQSFFELLKLPYPKEREGVLERLGKEKMIARNNGRYHITNLGALLLAKDLQSFEPLARKAVRVVKYEGKNKLKTLKDQIGKKGYAAGFEGLMTYLQGLLPASEEIGMAFRKEVSAYPSLAVRELVANALIHQDFRVKGIHPSIEVFSDRLEIANPGKPVVSLSRFIDEYQSRNEKLASFMRRIGICEEKGSGIDKVISEAERFQLPAPEFLETEAQTKVVLFAYRPLSEMTRQDKIRACYQHCCLKYVSSESMTNQSLRERFKMEDKDISMVSRIIKDTVKEGLIKPGDPDSASKKYSRYIPIWA